MRLTRMWRTGAERRHGLGWRTRLAALSLLTTAIAVPVVLAAPGVASAQNCPTGLDWVFGGYIIPDQQVGPIWFAERTTLVTSVPTFLVSEQRLADNSTSSQAVTATWTSSVSKTHQVTTTIGVGLNSDEFLKFLTANVSVNIVQSVTTSIGVSITAPIPPFSRIVGQYGVAGYDVTFDHVEYMALGPTRPDPSNPDASYCSEFNPANLPTRHTASAPTRIEGWRVIPG